MKKIIITLLCLLILSCSSEDETMDPFPFDGLVFKLTEVNVETSLDLNNDGIFSTNLIQEVDCLNTNQISFLNNSYLREGEIIELNIDDTGDYQYNCISHSSVGIITQYIGNQSLSISETISLNEIERTTFDFDGDKLIENRNESLPNLLSLVYTKQ